MISLVLQPVRVQAALAGLLGLLAALLCGWWLAAAGSGSTALQRSTLGPRALPKLPTGSDQPQMLQREREGLLARKQTFESQAKTQSEELTRLSKDAEKLQQQLKQAGAMTAEQQSVDAIKKNPPKWDLLKHEKVNKPEFDRLIVLWESATDAAAEQEAIRLLATNQSQWETEASAAMGNAATLRKKQAADLQTMKTTFQAESDKKLASLRDETTSLAEADKILEAIKMLFSGDTRASPGENFTNSAGIELVWVAEGNFWIGKTEVTGKQYNFVINGAAEGSDEPKDGVNFNNAIQYCEQLTAIEEGDSAVSDSNLKLRPEASAYMLPAVEQWNSTRTSPASTAVEGFSNELHEWSSSTYGGGGNYDSPKPNFPNAAVRPRYWTPSSDSPLVLRGNASPISLSPNTTSTIAAVFLGKSYPMWSGRLGFRVILISKP